MVTFVNTRRVREAAQDDGLLFSEGELTEDRAPIDEVTLVRCTIECLLRRGTGREEIEDMTPRDLLDWSNAFTTEADTVQVMVWGNDFSEPDLTDNDEFSDFALQIYCAMDYQLQSGTTWRKVKDMTFGNILDQYRQFLQEDVY